MKVILASEQRPWVNFDVSVPGKRKTKRTFNMGYNLDERRFADNWVTEDLWTVFPTIKQTLAELAELHGEDLRYVDFTARDDEDE